MTLDANDAFFGRPGSSRGQRRGAYPQARMTAVVECGTHAVFAAEVGPLSVRETALARRLFGRLAAGMLLLADRGFAGFDLWRVKSNAVLPVVETLNDGSYLSEIVAARDKNRRADPITVRVIEYTLD
ncbi:IS4 family transposase, partial [Streptomyces sp. NPDC018000]